MGKTKVAWILLIVLIIISLVLSYFKVLSNNNKNISEVPVDNSAAKAVDLALKQIVENFNNDEKINEYTNQNINMNAVLNNRSIFVSYKTDKVITYEFIYNNFNLSVNIENNDENMKRFEKVFVILNNAVQKRLNNDIDTESIVHDFLNNKKEVSGLLIDKKDMMFRVSVNIIEKINKDN